MLDARHGGRGATAGTAMQLTAHVQEGAATARHVLDAVTGLFLAVLGGLALPDEAEAAVGCVCQDLI